MQRGLSDRTDQHEPVVKRKNAAAAEAIAAAVRQPPSMRFVEPNSLDRQAAAILSRRSGSRARMTNGMRGLPTELGPIVSQSGKAPLDQVDWLADGPGDVAKPALAGIFACSEMVARFDDKIDASSSGCGRRPWPTKRGTNVNAGDVATIWPHSSMQAKEIRGNPAGLTGIYARPSSRNRKIRHRFRGHRE